jgi:DNA-binding GntR family transcriptional regulator
VFIRVILVNGKTCRLIAGSRRARDPAQVQREPQGYIEDCRLSTKCKEAIGNHEAAYDAMGRRDPDAARASMHAHLDGAARRLGKSRDGKRT